MKKIIIIMYLMISLMFLTPMSFAAQKVVEPACAQPSSVKDSLLMSIVTLCLPGIIEKTHEWKEIKCQTIKCAYNAVVSQAQLDPTFCYKVQDYETCKFIVGEIFAIPPMGILEYYRNAINELISNPVGVAYGAAVKVARKYVATNAGSAQASGVGAMSYLLAANDLMSVVEFFVNFGENGPFADDKDYCDDEIDEIKTKLEQVVNS